jgi:hypothetical protein
MILLERPSSQSCNLRSFFRGQRAMIRGAMLTVAMQTDIVFHLTAFVRRHCARTKLLLRSLCGATTARRHYTPSTTPGLESSRRVTPAKTRDTLACSKRRRTQLNTRCT